MKTCDLIDFFSFVCPIFYYSYRHLYRQEKLLSFLLFHMNSAGESGHYQHFIGKVGDHDYN